MRRASCWRKRATAAAGELVLEAGLLGDRRIAAGDQFGKLLQDFAAAAGGPPAP